MPTSDRATLSSRAGRMARPSARTRSAGTSACAAPASSCMGAKAARRSASTSTSACPRRRLTWTPSAPANAAPARTPTAAMSAFSNPNSNLKAKCPDECLCYEACKLCCRRARLLSPVPGQSVLFHVDSLWVKLSLVDCGWTV